MYTKELKIAVQAVKRSEKTFRKYFGTKTQVRMKNRNRLDLVSYADKQIEREIKAFLKKQFPSYGFIGEEHGHTNSNAEFVWALDPIDGTANYLQGISYCAISLGLLKNMKPVVGVVSAPALNLFYTARLGGKARLNGKIIRASKVTGIRDAFGSLGWGRDRAFGIKWLPRLLKQIRKMRVPGSAAVGFCYVAQGLYDFLIHSSLNIWDYAAGQIIIEEAGGVFINSKFKNLQIAANKMLAAKLFKLFK
ncbi:MAG: hypothetical protein A2751_01435 [Candidatus Doudnabacteria bacterium RIFCSPHIGHO2_01_FULL_46_14]|uniref:Inositol-phosphate phosphatase n=1 Tax=Candidatus Doudnabacteria bacterium RIFCSPHIGHO2_01_FULL_46_14 TaxID=1817824 RepID=A0A1F5NMI7_9BACT|nr:MAG: hypothetical protein A2751_01435 [Candidatus Doudnabacteria bacterium RIFCSPHIGHO2_01_FULL_46_14]